MINFRIIIPKLLSPTNNLSGEIKINPRIKKRRTNYTLVKNVNVLSMTEYGRIMNIHASSL